MRKQIKLLIYIVVVMIFILSMGFMTYAKEHDQSEHKVKVVYHLRGGINSKYNPSFYTKKCPLYLSNPVKRGYKFVGWTSKRKQGTLHLYAKWKKVKVSKVTTSKKYASIKSIIRLQMSTVLEGEKAKS